jgi:hypothetical protein
MSTYGLCLIAATFIWWTWTERTLLKKNIPLADWVMPSLIVVAWLGGRLGVILTEPDTMTDVFSQLITLRVFEYTWWTAVGLSVLLLWRLLPSTYGLILQHMSIPLLVAYGIVTLGATVGGTAIGTSTTLPWGIESYGDVRHPVGAYEALIVWVGALWLVQRQRAGESIGWAAISVFAAQELLCGGFRLNGWVIGGGLHITQLVGLVTLIVAHERVIMTNHKQT